MTLLFDTVEGGAFSNELKDALGFIDADFPLRKILPDIRTATNDLLEIIGQEVYDEIVTIKGNEAPTDEEKELLRLARYAIAVQAYFYFAPMNDLSHGTNGRTMITTDDKKTPFEHMIVKSDDDLQRRTYRAIDDLIRFLDETNDTWKQSEEFEKSHKLFVRSVSEFNEYFIIDSRLLLLKLRPGIAKAEREAILPRIGTTIFNSIKSKRNGGSIEPLLDEEALLLPLIQEACAYLALSWGVTRLQGNLFPDGVLQAIRGDRTTIKGRMAFTGNQIDQLEQLFSGDASKALIEIEKIIKDVEAEDVNHEPVTDEDIAGMINFCTDNKGVST